MATQQILVLLFQVRVLVAQPRRKRLWASFLFVATRRSRAGRARVVLFITLIVMEFRKAVYSDVDEIVEIVKGGQERLRAQGIDQWQRGYPNRGSIEADVAAEVGMVLCDGGRVAAYAAVIFTGEPAYEAISGGGWLTDGPYAVVHRLCVAADFLRCGCGVEFMRRVERFAADVFRACVSTPIPTTSSCSFW